MGKIGKSNSISIKSLTAADDFDKMMDEMLQSGMDSTIGDAADEIAAADETIQERGQCNAVDGDVDKTRKVDMMERIDVSSKTLEEKLNDIYNEFLEDVSISVANIKDIAFREAAIKGRWCSRLMAERVRGKRLRQALDKLIKELGEIADSKATPNSYLAAKMQKDAAINANAEVVELRREISESKDIQDFLTNLYDCVKGLGYTVKNSLDVLNLERGI